MQRRERRTTKEAADLEWPLEITLCWLAQDVNRDRLGVVQILQSHERLYK